MIATGLVECLLRFLKGGINNQLLLYRANKLDAQEPVPPSLSATYFGRAAALVDRLQLLLTAAQASTSTNQNIWLVEICFSTILEISLCSKVIWNYFTGHSSTAQLLRSLLLENTHEKIREGVVASVRRVCGTMPS
ncbi:hypothetical protein MMC13_001871, partial [Lambiella insularis]|nr:hypothetical protein [Lambiella insularis]